MLFYKKEGISSVWKQATDLFYSGQLEGVFAMKISTNTHNARSTDDTEKVGVIWQEA